MRFLLDLLFPPKCTFCGKFLKTGESEICAKCRKDLPYTQGEQAKTKGDFFTVCVSPLYYQGDVRASIHRFKFKGRSNYAAAYGKLVAQCIQDHLVGRYDLISWVPLSAGRLKKRGYDQAMLLCMAAALELSDVGVETLRKQKEVPAQSGMGAPEKRRANISGAYEVVDPELVAGRRILLIDDVITSASTLSECAKTLLMAGAEEVLCATLAKVGHQE